MVLPTTTAQTAVQETTSSSIQGAPPGDREGLRLLHEGILESENVLFTPLGVEALDAAQRTRPGASQNAARHDAPPMDWDEFNVALQALNGEHVSIDVVVRDADNDHPAAGMRGVLASGPIKPRTERRGDSGSLALRVKPQDSDDTAYLNVLRSSFHAAKWHERGGKRLLVIRWSRFTAFIEPTSRARARVRASPAVPARKAAAE